MIEGKCEENGEELLQFLRERLELSGKAAKKLLDSRRVFVNQSRVWMARHKLSRGDLVQVFEPERVSRASEITILFQNADFLIVNKPPGILSVGNHSIEERLRESLGQKGIKAAHRLDRHTSGCMLLCRNDAALERVKDRFRNRLVKKRYLAIALGQVKKRSFQISAGLDGKSAVSRVRTLDCNRRASLLDVKIETGRTHQVRRHLASIGHPLAGDDRYGLSRAKGKDAIAAHRQMLHAAEISFKDRAGHTQISASAPIPQDFRDCIREMRLREKRVTGDDDK